MIKQKYRKCKYCGCIGGWFITRKSKLASGKSVLYADNVCCLCANEIARTNYYRRRKDPEYIAKENKRLRDFKSKNKSKIKAQNRIYWIKNKDKIIERRNLKKELKEKPVNKLKINSHHRVPSKNHPLRGIDFRSMQTLKGKRENERN